MKAWENECQIRKKYYDTLHIYIYSSWKMKKKKNAMLFKLFWYKFFVH